MGTKECVWVELINSEIDDGLMGANVLGGAEPGCWSLSVFPAPPCLVLVLQHATFALTLLLSF